jgi:hypothetical protein
MPIEESRNLKKTYTNYIRAHTHTHTHSKEEIVCAVENGRMKGLMQGHTVEVSIN